MAISLQEDNSITRAATKTKRTKHSVRKGGDTSTEIRRQTRSASRLEQDSDEEEEKDGDEYIDPRSYLASKRGWQTCLVILIINKNLLCD